MNDGIIKFINNQARDFANEDASIKFAMIVIFLGFSLILFMFLYMMIIFLLTNPIGFAIFTIVIVAIVKGAIAFHNYGKKLNE